MAIYFSKSTGAEFRDFRQPCLLPRRRKQPCSAGRSIANSPRSTGAPDYSCVRKLRLVPRSGLENNGPSRGGGKPRPPWLRQRHHDQGASCWNLVKIGHNLDLPVAMPEQPGFRPKVRCDSWRYGCTLCPQASPNLPRRLSFTDQLSRILEYVAHSFQKIEHVRFAFTKRSFVILEFALA